MFLSWGKPTYSCFILIEKRIMFNLMMPQITNFMEINYFNFKISICFYPHPSFIYFFFLQKSSKNICRNVTFLNDCFVV